MELTIDTSREFSVAHVADTLTAQDDAEFIDQLQPLAAEPNAKLAIVMTELKSVDSAGLGVLIGLVTRARLREGRVILVGPTPFVRGVLEVTQLDTWFEICDDLDEAARRFA